MKTAPILPRLLGVLFFVTLLPAQHQTAEFDDPVAPAQIPYQLELRAIELTAEIPTLHSYVAGQLEGEWILLSGRTNGLHGLTGLNAFDPAFENREVWVIDPLNDRSWRKSLESAPASGLTADEVDSLSSVNAQFKQVGTTLYIVGGYGFRRAEGDHRTYNRLTAIDLPGLIDWVKAEAGTEISTAADHIRQIEDEFFRVTGGGLEVIGDEFQLIFGQNYHGRYRPMFNGIHTRQVRRFRIQSAFPELVLIPGSKLATPENANFRRRDLNVLPILERDANDPTRLIEKAMALSGVFTLEGGVWTLPVLIEANGVVRQLEADEAGGMRQAVQQYHCAKALFYHRATDEMHCVLFGGISLKYWDAPTERYLADDNVPFVNDITTVVRHADGSIRQYRLPFLFPPIAAPWDNSKNLLFGTNAEFFAAPEIPRIGAKIIDLALIGQPTRIGWLHGGIMAEAPNFGRTAASGHVFEVWLIPDLPHPPDVRLEPADGGYRLVWDVAAGRDERPESSSDLKHWIPLRQPNDLLGIRRLDFSPPSAARFHRMLFGKTTEAP